MIGDTGGASDPERRNPTPQTIKKLFAYSGNVCACPGCKNELVDEGGTMLGKIAHVHAAKPGGARFDPGMDDERRRAFENLLVVCGPCHDKVDDMARQDEFPAAVLLEWKERHESRFRKAESQFIDLYRDLTAEAEPTYPLTLHALADALGKGSLRDSEEHVASIGEFIGKLRCLPLPTRTFAFRLTQRLMTRGKKNLLAQDVAGAFGITFKELEEHSDLLTDHELGGVDTWGDGKYFVELRDREWGGNPFEEMIKFCEATGVKIERMLYQLDFALYDAVK